MRAETNDDEQGSTEHEMFMIRSELCVCLVRADCGGQETFLLAHVKRIIKCLHLRRQVVTSMRVVAHSSKAAHGNSFWFSLCSLDMV